MFWSCDFFIFKIIVPFPSPPLLALVCPNSQTTSPIIPVGNYKQGWKRMNKRTTDPFKKGLFLYRHFTPILLAVNVPFSVVWFANVHRNSFLSWCKGKMHALRSPLHQFIPTVSEDARKPERLPRNSENNLHTERRKEPMKYAITKI